MNPSKKLLVLVVDAANPALLRSWAADGTLPNIGKLMAAGVSADLCGPDPLYVGSTWPSFYTGLNPAGHGFYWTDHLRSGTYRIHHVTPDDFARRQALWEVLSAVGRRVLVMDVPLTRLSPGLNGIQVIEWRTHDVIFGFQTAPRSVGRRILASVGRHPAPAACDAPRRSLAEYREFAAQLARGATARAQLTNQLLADEQWDFAIQVFGELHCAGHQLWHFHDPSHPAFDAAITGANGNLLRDVYIAVDAAIGEILAQAEPTTTVAVVTLHGMSYLAGASQLLPEILRRLGVSAAPSAAPSPRPRTGRDRVLGALRAAYHLLPDAFRRPLWRFRSRIAERWLATGSPIPIDPAKTRCFAVDTGPGVGGIRLNLRGREPAGILSAGAEADAFCAELTTHLMELIRPDTGRPIVRQVRRTTDLFQGANADALPDLLVEWDLDAPVGTTAVGVGAGAVLRAHSPRIGLVEAINDHCRTGEHRREGLLIARGPGLVPGALDRVVATVDLAPTFAQMLGTEMTPTDGKAVPELLGQ